MAAVLAPDAHPRLVLRDVAVARGAMVLLEGVSLTLQAGEAVVVQGANGIGKTTLLRAIVGLLPAASGRIDLAEDSASYAGHADGMKATLSVVENLTFWRAIFGGPDIGPALQAMGLQSLAQRPAGSLSAGQKRRLGLARMLVTGRPLWVLDEPTVSLDAGATAAFAGMIRSHLARGGAALIASHVDIGLHEATRFDLAPYQARPRSTRFDEAFA